MGNETTYILKNSTEKNAKCRREKFDGQDYLVLPVVAAKSMVMNGLYYPPDVFEQWAKTWNGSPITLSHPSINDVPTSANQPKILENNSVGIIFNAEYKKGSLVCELWINIEKAKKLKAFGIVEKIENGEVMEVSTGLTCEVENKEGTHEGVKYKGIIKNIRPDHIALLPNEIGACSVKDGCGTNMTINKKKCECKEGKGGIKENGACKCKTTVIDKVSEAFKLLSNKFNIFSNSDSFSDIERKIASSVIEEEGEDCYIIQTWSDHFVYSIPIENGHKESIRYKRSYNVSEGKVILGDDKIEVIMKTTWEPVIKDVSINKEGIKMPEQEELPVVNKTEPEIVNVSQTLDERVKTSLSNMADKEVSSLLTNALADSVSSKKEMVTNIVLNSNFTEEELSNLPIEHIRKLENSLASKSNDSKEKKSPNYSGRSTSHTNKSKGHVVRDMFNYGKENK